MLFRSGDARQQSLRSIWLGPKMMEARRIHLQHQGVEQIDICRMCHLPRQRETSFTQINGNLIQVDNYQNRVQEIGS